jgi:hypothetical protein
VWAVSGPALAAALDAWAPALAAAAVGGLLAVVGVPMGMPFPRLLEAWAVPPGVAAAFAASGVSAVVAGAGSLWLAHAAGAPAIGWAAACAYVLAAAIHPSISKSAAESGGAKR